jgi:hypothetical protein
MSAPRLRRLFVVGSAPGLSSRHRRSKLRSPWCGSTGITRAALKACMAIHIGLIGGGNITDTHARARTCDSESKSRRLRDQSWKVAALCHEHGGKAYQDFDAFAHTVNGSGRY